MIEITYADMFLFVVILFLLAIWVKTKVEMKMQRKAMMRGLYALHEGKAEVIVDEVEGSIRLQEKV